MRRILVDQGIMDGKPVIRGTRLTVDYILGLIAHGATIEEILREYDGLEADDIRACLRHRHPRRWDLELLAQSGEREDRELAERGLAEWAEALDREDHG